jgi:IS30 family transposase
MPRGYQRLSPAEIDALWIRMRAGQAAKPTARALGLPTSTVRDYLRRCGGIRPAPRRRSPGRLSFAEREEISRGLATGLSLRVIASRLDRSASTVSREVATHGGRSQYRAATADQLAWSWATRPKACKLATNPALAAVVTEKLKRRWSPQQIAGWLKVTYPDNQQMQVSHESIYRTLFVQSRGALRKELTAHLRTGRVLRRPQGVRLPDGRGGRPGILNISERPAEAEDRAVPGHWEGDLIIGTGRSAIGTLVERSSRSTLLVHLPRLEGWGENPPMKNGPSLGGYGSR